MGSVSNFDIFRKSSSSSLSSSKSMNILKDTGSNFSIFLISSKSPIPACISVLIIDLFLIIFSLSLYAFRVFVLGFVFGISITVVKPPFAAAIDPLFISSLYVNPGSLKCTWGSISPGNTICPLMSIVLSESCGSFEILDIFPLSIPIVYSPFFPMSLQFSKTKSFIKIIPLSFLIFLIFYYCLHILNLF